MLLTLVLTSSVVAKPSINICVDGEPIDPKQIAKIVQKYPISFHSIGPDDSAKTKASINYNNNKLCEPKTPKNKTPDDDIYTPKPQYKIEGKNINVNQDGKLVYSQHDENSININKGPKSKVNSKSYLNRKLLDSIPVNKTISNNRKMKQLVDKSVDKKDINRNNSTANEKELKHLETVDRILDSKKAEQQNDNKTNKK